MNFQVNWEINYRGSSSVAFLRCMGQEETFRWPRAFFHLESGVSGLISPLTSSSEIQGQPGKLLRPLRTRRGGVLGPDLESCETFHQPRKLGFRLCCPHPLWSHLQVQESACSHHHRSNKSFIQLSINSDNIPLKFLFSFSFVVFCFIQRA